MGIYSFVSTVHAILLCTVQVSFSVKVLVRYWFRRKDTYLVSLLLVVHGGSSLVRTPFNNPCRGYVEDIGIYDGIQYIQSDIYLGVIFIYYIHSHSHLLYCRIGLRVMASTMLWFRLRCRVSTFVSPSAQYAAVEHIVARATVIVV